MCQWQSNSTHMFLACAMPHAKSWCFLFGACAHCRARKGRGVHPQPLLVVAGLMLAVAQARVQILFEPLVFKLLVDGQ